MYLIVLFPPVHVFLCATSALYFTVCKSSQDSGMEYDCDIPNHTAKK